MAKRINPSKETRQQIIKDPRIYREIAVDHGVSTSFVEKTKREAGIYRARGRAGYSSEFKQKVIHDLRSRKDIAKAFGIAEATITAWRKEAGVETPKHKPTYAPRHVKTHGSIPKPGYRPSGILLRPPVLSGK